MFDKLKQRIKCFFGYHLWEEYTVRSAKLRFRRKCGIFGCRTKEKKDYQEGWGWEWIDADGDFD